MQVTMVESYMRTVFYIGRSVEYTWSGYPSEPMLSEAAAQLLNKNIEDPKQGIMDRGPDIVSKAIKDDLLVRSEHKRGRLVAELLLMIAHDLAVKSDAEIQVGRRVQFHLPIPLLRLLKKLFAPQVWEIVRKAQLLFPSHATPVSRNSKNCDPANDDVNLETIFANAWVNFSHFAKLGDHQSFNLGTMTALLRRGAAAETCDGQEEVDIAVPLFFGDPRTTEICTDCTSVMQIKVKNSEVPAQQQDE